MRRGAARVHGPWRKITPYERGRLLQKAAALIEKHGEELAQLITLENGKPLWEAKKEVAHRRELDGVLRRLDDEAAGRDDPGVAAGAVSELHDARAAGRGRRHHAAELSADDAAVQGRAGAGDGQHRSSSSRRRTRRSSRCGWRNCSSRPACPRACSTSSPAIGETAGRGARRTTTTSTRSPSPARPKSAALLVRASAGNLKKVSLELGGKSPNIVFADADLDAALKGVFMGIFFCQGEICSAGSRLFVEESIYDEFVARLAEMARAVRLGHGLDPETKMGPLVSREQQERVLDYIRIGKEENARAVAGGRCPGRRAGRRILRRADGLHRRDQRDAHRPRGNLRPGGLRDAVQRPARRGREGQRHALRPGRRRVDARPPQGASGRRGARRRHGVGELLQRLRQRLALGRHQAERLGPRKRARTGSTCSRRSSR